MAWGATLHRFSTSPTLENKKSKKNVLTYPFGAGVNRVVGCGQLHLILIRQFVDEPCAVASRTTATRQSQPPGGHATGERERRKSELKKL